MLEAPKPKLSKQERVAQNIKRLKETGSYCVKTASNNLKEGQTPLQEINDRINQAHSINEIFLDMKILMTAVATAKGYIKKGQSKIRKGGTPDDFLNYCTMKMCERWKRQGDILTSAVGQTKIDNWCAYGQIVMFNYLIEYNKSIFDMDVSQIPLQVDKDGEITEVEVEDSNSLVGFQDIALYQSISTRVIKDALSHMPLELQVYAIDILYYLTYEKLLDKAKENFVKIGVKFFRRMLQNELGD